MDRYLGQTNRLQRYLKFILITRIEKQSSTHAGERFSCHFVVALFFQKFDRTLTMKNGVTIRHCLAPPPLYIFMQNPPLILFSKTIMIASHDD